MLMRPDKVPDRTSWTEVPNLADYYISFARERFGSRAEAISREAKEFLRVQYENVSQAVVL